MAGHKNNRIRLSTVFSVILTALFIVKTVNSFKVGAETGEGASALIKYAVIPLIIVFAVCFIVSIVQNFRNGKAIKESSSDTKYAVKTTAKVASVLEAAAQLISVAVAIIIAYDEYASGNVKWYDFRYYFTLIILIFTFLNTVYYIVKTSLKLKRKADKRKDARIKSAEKEQRAEERKKIIEEASAEKVRRQEERAAREKADMPVKNQSHKPVKKITKK